MGSPALMTVEQVTERLIDYRGKTPPKTDAGVRLITAKVIKRGQIVLEPAEYIAVDFYDEWMRRGLPQDLDVLITTEAPLGEVALLRFREPVALAQRVILLRANPGVIDPVYLFYALQSEVARADLHARASGTTVSGIKQSELRQVRVPVPAVPVQRRIARILSAYDDLIENCERRIRLLDEMARALYREWFVLFRYPGHEKTRFAESPLGRIPKGWRFGTLSTVARVNAEQVDVKRPPARIQYIDISSVSPGNVESFTEYDFEDAPGRARRVVHHGDVLWSCVRPNRRSHALVLFPDEATIASTGFAVLTAEEVPFTYLYAATTTDEFVGYLEKRATGAAYPAVTAKVFEDAPLLIPEPSVLERYAVAVNPSAEAVALLRRRIENLRKTRDLLLPRLLSGQLELADAT